MAISVNLLPDIKQQRLRAQRRKRNFILIALGIMAVGVLLPLVAGLTLGTQQVILNNLRDNNKSGLNDLRETEGINEALTAQNQLNSIFELRNSGEDISGFFDIIERAVTPNATLSSVEITDDGTLELIGSAKDVDTVNIIVQSISSFTPSGLNLDKFDENRQPFVSSVNVKSIDPGEDDEDATFSIEAIFNFALLDVIGDEIDAAEGGGDPFNTGGQN